MKGLFLSADLDILRGKKAVGQSLLKLLPCVFGVSLLSDNLFLWHHEVILISNLKLFAEFD